MPDASRKLSRQPTAAEDWRTLYQSAMLESDRTKRLERILEARHAVLDRAEELLTGAPSDERSVLNDALRALRVLEQVAVKSTSGRE
jgi:hypothetical protein